MKIEGSQIQNALSYLQNKASSEITADEKMLLAALQDADQVKGITLTPALADIFNECVSKSKNFMSSPSPNIDFGSAIETMNNLENLMLLVSSLSRTLREAKFQETQNLLSAKKQELLASADLKMQGAAEMRAHAKTAMILGIIAGGVSALGGLLSLGGVGLFGGTERGLQGVASFGKMFDGGSQILSAVGTGQNAEGQALNQEKQAQADGKQAEASQLENLAQQQKDMESIAKDLLAKMSDMLRTIHDAKQKALEAAAKA